MAVLSPNMLMACSFEESGVHGNGLINSIVRTIIKNINYR